MKQLIKKDVGKSKPDADIEKIKKEIFRYIQMNGDSTLDDISGSCRWDYQYQFLKAMTELWEEGVLDEGDEGFILYR